MVSNFILQLKIIMSTKIRYSVMDDGRIGFFSKLNYSKYNLRLLEFQQGNLKEEEVYGYQHALDHVNELKAKPEHFKTSFRIQKETITTEIIEL